MIVTTAGRTNKERTDYANRVAAEINTTFVKRNDIPVHQLHEQYEHDVLVVGKNRVAIYPKGTVESFFFHPNSAMFRVKRLMRG
ncbi:protein-L-IsoD(D-D) O-methyltransferase, partial [Bacillus anthracis]|nr:protein-L-IsoD(D-D) O-methyltransferase [Bacillus anthracis]